MKSTANTSLRRVYLDIGGYEYGSGKYFGTGMPLYRFIFDDGKRHETATFRAADRNQAKELARVALKDMGLEPVFYR